MAKISKFKQTDIGPIPEDWEVASFDDCFRLLSNNTYAREFMCHDMLGVANIHYGDVLIRYGSILDASQYPIDSLVPGVSVSGERLKDGDLIFADTAEDETVGKAAEVQNLGTRHAVSGLHTIPCRPKIDFAPGWLGYYTNSACYHNQLLPLITGTKVSSVSKACFRQTSLSHPPTYSEQAKIAGALRDTDALLMAYDELIEKKKAIKVGAMQELLTGKRRLTGFYEPWVEKRLGLLGNIIRDTINPSEYPFENFVEYSMPAFDNRKRPVKARGVTMRSSRIRILNNVLLFNKLNVHQRRIWYVEHCPVNAVCSSEFLPYYSNVIDLKFLSYLLSTNKATKCFVEQSSGTSNSQKRITASDFESLYLLIPPSLAEQKAIAEVLSDMDAEIAELEREREKTRQIKQGMMQELLTGRTRLEAA